MFKAISAGALAIGLLGGGAAQAGIVPPLYNWTGFYIGGYVAGLSGHLTPAYGEGPSGIDVGLTVEYAWQNADGWVFTPFVSVPIAGQTGVPATLSTSKINWGLFGGAKVGLAVGRWQPYGLVAAVVGQGTASNLAVTRSNTHHGLIFGLGADYALTDHWTVGGRFSHIAMDAQNYNGAEAAFSANSVAATFAYKLK